MPGRAANNLSAMTIQFPSSSVTRHFVYTTNKFITTPDTGASNEPDPALTRCMGRSVSNEVRVVLSNNRRINVNLRSAVMSLAKSVPVVLHPNCIARGVLRRITGRISISGAVLSTGYRLEPGTPKVHCHRCTPGKSLAVVRNTRSTIGRTVYRGDHRTATGKRHIKVVTASRAVRTCHRGDGTTDVGDIKDHLSRTTINEDLCQVLQRFSSRGLSVLFSRSFTRDNFKRTVVGQLLGTTNRRMRRM